MGLADTVTKAYMKENTVFADAFNYLIYGCQSCTVAGIGYNRNSFAVWCAERE